MSPARRLRPTRWLTIVIGRRPPPDPGAGVPLRRRRLFVSAAWLLAVVALLVPALELTVHLHDRSAVARAFACVEERRAAWATAAAIAAPVKGRPEGPRGGARGGEGEPVEIDLDGLGHFTFPAGLTDQETVAALQALAVAHHAAGHGSHGATGRATAPAQPAAAPPAEPRVEFPAALEKGCGVAREGGERYAWRAWRRDNAEEPPSERAESAAERAVARSLLAPLPLALLFGIRAWLRWLRAPAGGGPKPSA